jgi:hypothetical protein
MFYSFVNVVDKVQIAQHRAHKETMAGYAAESNGPDPNAGRQQASNNS